MTANVVWRTGAIVVLLAGVLALSAAAVAAGRVIEESSGQKSVAVGTGTEPSRAAGLAAGALDASGAAGDSGTLDALSGLADVSPEQKLSPGVDEAAAADPKAMAWLVVLSTEPVDLSAVDPLAHQFVWPDGEHVSLLHAPVAEARELATMHGVFAVKLAAADEAVEISTAPVPQFTAPRSPDPVLRGRALREAPPWGVPNDVAAETYGDGTLADAETVRRSAIEGWFDVRAGHAAEEAWALGYRGEGVRVAVLDNAADFAHPDLQGTWAELPVGHDYEGWPQVFDPNVGLATIMDQRLPPFMRSSRTAQSGRIEMYQESLITSTLEAGETWHTACFQPAVFGMTIGDFVLADPDCDYEVPGTSKSGEVRYGHHPDTSLRSYADLGGGAEGAWAGVLLVDENTAHVYDTVYVDVDGDRDFTDEKPMTKQSPVGWRDIDGDTLADVSAGLLYWISDGELPFPVSWAWGLQQNIEPASSTIGILWAGGSHGTLCASNVVSQGVLKVPPERQLRFRDLEGGEPPSTNHGLAPDAALVSVGDVYESDATFAAGWRYVMFGHDPASKEDDIQIASNSYGFSDVDNDGWDADSRIVDYLVRAQNPALSFLIATGNGAPGYGTVTAPKPIVALGVAGSTQMGSTGSDITANAMDSITDTAQITFGDIIPWSNRGPGSDGDIGVHIAADGADASGAVPVNTASDGAHANGTWNGTSRSTPVLAGGMALVYEAYREATGEWPTWDVARSIVMSGARFNGYDTLTAGAGVLDAADAVRIASGRRGIRVSPSVWRPGGYRGATYPGFAHVVRAGETATTTLTLHNPTNDSVDVSLSAQTLRRTGSYTASLTTDPSQQSPPSDVPDYLLPVDHERIPTGTDLMVARMVYPLHDFDRDGDYASDNRFSMAVMQHTDVNGDGLLWDDRNGNGVVNHEQLPGAFVQAVWDGGTQEAPAVEGFWITQALDVDGVTGQAAWFGDGCDGGSPGMDVKGKIAVVSRGACRFQNKVANAQRAGAIGAIIFTDARPKAIMFALPSGLTTPALMIDQAPGEALRDLLQAGTTVTATMGVRHTMGLDGAAPIVWDSTEIQQYEYMRFSVDEHDHNNSAVSVHHPLERLADGMYLGLWHIDPATAIGAAVMGSSDHPEVLHDLGHEIADATLDAEGMAKTARVGEGNRDELLGVGATQAITSTTLQFRFDFYSYEPWDDVALSDDTVSIPAEGSVDVVAGLTVQDDASPGILQGAVFADYDREARTPIFMPALLNRGAFDAQPAVTPGPAGRLQDLIGRSPDTTAGDPDDDAESELLPGGYELPFLRTVVPVNVNIAAGYEWQGVVELGGEDARDADATYDNGAMWGTFTWDWRAESGDWRFFFIDSSPPRANTRWLYRTVWRDSAQGAADIDTRIYGPLSDQYSDPDHPDNERSDRSDPDWYGPHTMGLLGRSPYLVSDGSVWPFHTSSGDHEDWVEAPAGQGGLHEVMLHNVLFSGTDFSLPFTTEVGSAQLSTETVQLVNDECYMLEITPTLKLEDLSVRAFGVAEPQILESVPVSQDNPRDVSTTTFRHPVSAATEAGRFVVGLEGEDDDDLDLFVLFDVNGDGTFEYPAEVVGESTTATAAEEVALPGFAPAGEYEVWVHGYQVTGDDSTFDLLIEVVSGDSLKVRQSPESIAADETGSIEVCADVEALQDSGDQASGMLVIGPGAAPQLISLAVQWRRLP